MTKPVEPATPLPWELKGIGKTQVYHKGRHVADCGGRTDLEHLRRQDHENAAYIVEACNGWAELQQPCVWRWDEDRQRWNAGCGPTFCCFGRYRCGVNYCAYCGHPIQEKNNE